MLDGTELEILKWVRGPLYRRRRDAALAQSVDMAAVLEASRRQPDPRITVVATILAAWKDHGPRYEAFLASFGQVNLERAAKTVTGIGGVIQGLAYDAEQALGEAILPLCWEQILKFTDELPDWQLATFLAILRKIPAGSSIEPLLWMVEQETDPGRIDGAHQALILLPYGGMKARLSALKEALAFRAFVVDDLLARIKAGQAPGS
jgi:hypothetical protein